MVTNERHAMIDHLRRRNPHLQLHHVNDQQFGSFGRVHTAYDCQPWLAHLDADTPAPDDGTVYVASDPTMESLSPYDDVRDNVFGGLDIQVGYCNGHASRLNGLEYHKSPEFFVAQTDLVLLLAQCSAMRDFTIDSAHVAGFFVPAGSVLELFGTTLHFAPTQVDDAGFKSVIVLLRGTNTEPPPATAHADDPESTLLFRRGKWLLAHPDDAALLARGAVSAIVGDNLEVAY